MHTSKKTRQKIIDTARVLFDEHGYDNVSIKDICSAMKFGRSTFYYHFKTKEQLLAEFYHSESVYTTDNMSWILTAPSNLERAYRIQLVYENHLVHLGSDDAVLIFIISALSNKDEKSIDSLDQVRKLLIPVIEQCQQSGEIRNQTPASELCEVALRIQSGIILQYFMIDNTINREKALIESLNVLYNPE